MSVTVLLKNILLRRVDVSTGRSVVVLAGAKMGKSHKLLTIVALPPCDTWEELWYLEQKGHTIIRPSIAVGEIALRKITDRELLDADIIIGSNCWRMGPQHQKYLVLALVEARMLKYPENEKKRDKKRRKELDAIVTAGLKPLGKPSTDDADTAKQS